MTSMNDLCCNLELKKNIVNYAVLLVSAVPGVIHLLYLEAINRKNSKF